MKKESKSNTVWDSFIKSMSQFGGKPKKHFLLAVSGGIDSMVLAYLFHKSTLSFEIAHVNYQLRGEDSNKDAQLVYDFCSKRNITCHLLTSDTHDYCSKNKVGIQEYARNIRYDWFKELKSKNNLDFIVTAHHLDDSVETFLINAVRGSGIRGLKGIEEFDQESELIRPLINLTKKELEAYADLEKIEFRVDQSNLKNDYLRNMIRNKVIPELEQKVPHLNQKMAITLRNIQMDADFLESRAQAEADTVLIKTTLGFEIVSPNTVHPRVLLCCLERFDFPNTLLNEVLKTSHSGKTFLGKSHQILVDRNKLIITENRINKTEPFEMKIEGLGSFCFDDKHTMKLELIQEPNLFDSTSKTAFLNFEKLQFPLTWRTWEKGDSFIPFGMKGKKKVSDFLTDHKLTQIEKEATTVLLSDNKIIWVVGMRIAENYKIEKNCKKIIKIVT